MNDERPGRALTARSVCFIVAARLCDAAVRLGAELAPEVTAMVCVVNPDGTITCSDGDGGVASELAKVAAAAKQGPQNPVETTYSGDLGKQLKAAADALSKKQQPMAILLVDATVVNSA